MKEVTEDNTLRLTHKEQGCVYRVLGQSLDSADEGEASLISSVRRKLEKLTPLISVL